MGKRKGGGGHGSDNLRMAKKHKQQHHPRKQQNLPQTQLYTLQDKILVLGDGDFTFSRGLATHRGGGANMYATSFDSSSQVRKKYSNANECIAALTTANAQVLHGIDGTKLDAALPSSIPALFDYIIFNFPHSGQQRVHINRVLLLDFFESARPKLAFKGEVHITLKTKPPYSNWNVEDQAKASGFVMKERRPFRIDIFPGYHHRTTDPTAKTFEPAQCITYVYVVDRSRYPVPTIQEPSEPAKAPVSQLESPTQPASRPLTKKAPVASNPSAHQAFKDALATAPTSWPVARKVPSSSQQLSKPKPDQPTAATTTKAKADQPTTSTTTSTTTPKKKPLSTNGAKKVPQQKRTPSTANHSETSQAVQVTNDIRQLCVDMLLKVRQRRS